MLWYYATNDADVHTKQTAMWLRDLKQNKNGRTKHTKQFAFYTVCRIWYAEDADVNLRAVSVDSGLLAR